MSASDPEMWVPRAELERAVFDASAWRGLLTSALADIEVCGSLTPDTREQLRKRLPDWQSAASSCVDAVKLHAFLKESLAIEGIHRDPTPAERFASAAFLAKESIDPWDIEHIQAVYAPGNPLRTCLGMNVRVGGHRPPPGGPDILFELMRQLGLIRRREITPFRAHQAFETLHPFMDGNGRTGRILWAWQMLQLGEDPFAISFLQRFYYQSLEAADGR